MTPDEFRALHVPGTPLLLPNAWDFASAAALAADGFTAIGTTSLGVAAAAGVPDATGVTADLTLSLAELICRLPVGVSVDIEGGFSERPAEVADYVARLADLGVVGVNIEDGRQDTALAPAEHVARLVTAIKQRTPRIFVNARTDAYWLRLPDPASEAIHRGRTCLDAGADGFFVPGVTEPAEITALVTSVGAPLNVLFGPGNLTVSALAELGVARISTGSLLFRASLAAVTATARAVADGADTVHGIPTYQDVQQLAAD